MCEPRALLAMALAWSFTVATAQGAVLPDPALILPPPPASGTAAARTDLDQLRGIDRAAEPKLQEAAKALGQIKNVTLFADVLGPKFQLSALPATRALFDALRAAEKPAVDRAKTYFRRSRPWLAEPDLHTCSRNEEPLSSYPSGHTTNGFAMATVLARLLPSRAPAILARAAEYAHSRLVCEVHYPTDVSAGELYGTLIAERLMESPDFHTKFAAAERELRAAGLS